MNNRWQANRIGLVNFWYYDDQEFSFAKGRMLLRGANGSGKSVTMQSVVPLLLDGNMSPERLDPFGSRDRKMNSYLLEDDDNRDERTGYLYLEFKRKEHNEYMTIGMGIRARKGKPLDKWYFAISDGRRVGVDFLLYKSIGEKITLSKKELENRIEEGGFVFDKQAEYMDYVNNHIFGFETREEYKELIDLLIQLRTPKLSKDFKPSVINEILSDSLQPLSDDDLRPMSEAIENMDELSRKLKDKEGAIGAAEKIGKVYDRYNKLVLFNKALSLQETEEEIANIKLDQVRKEKELNQKRQQIEENEKKRKEMDAQNRTMELERETLSKSDAALLKKRELELQREIEDFKTKSSGKERDLETKNHRLIDLEYRIKDEENEKYSHQKELNQLLEEMSDEAENMAFDEHAFFMDELLKQVDECFDYSVHKKQFYSVRDSIRKTFNILETAEQFKKERELISEKRDRTARTLDSAQRKKNEAENLLIETQEFWKESLYRWEQENAELKIEKSVLGQISRFADEYNISSDYNQVRRRVADIRQEFRSRLQSMLYEKNQLKTETEKCFKLKKGELNELENSRELIPVRSEAVLKNRARLKAEGIPYKELYKTLEFSDSLDEETCNRIEEAFEAMGLLDALVIEERYKEKVLSFNEGCADKYLFSGKSQTGNSILNVLQLNDEINDLFTNYSITGILGSISYNGEGQTAVYSDGRYELGPISGTTSGLGKASFLGTRAREKALLERIESYKKEIKILEEEINTLGNECAELERRIEKLEQEYESFPLEEDLKTALSQFTECDAECTSLENEVNKLESELKNVNNQIREKQEAAYECGKMLHLDISFSIFKQAKESSDDYDKLLISLIPVHELYLKTVQTLKNLNLQDDELKDDISQIRDELGDISNVIMRKEKELDSVSNQLLLTNYDEIRERLDLCTAWFESFPGRLQKTTEIITICTQECIFLEKEIADDGSRLESLLKNCERLKKSFEKEVMLEYVVIPEEVGNSSKAVIKFLKADVEGLSWEGVNQKLNETYYQHRDLLNEYQISLKTDLFEEEDEDLKNGSQNKFENNFGKNYMPARRNDIRARYKGVDIPFFRLVSYLKEEIVEIRELIKDGDRELFEDILSNTVSRKIRSKINAATSWIANMNRLMGNMNTSSGLKLSLKWRSKTAEIDNQLDTARLVELLKKDYLSMTEEEGKQLSDHFRSKVEQARINSSANGGLISFYQVMKDTLDYRKWFEFQLFTQKTGERQRELTNSVFGTFSGGEKAMSMYVPLFSAVYAKYDGAGNNAPRLISLDEAFAGVDSKNIKDMFRLMSEFDFDFIINSQVLWGDSDTLDALAIYNLQRPENAKFVTVMTYLWNGFRREALENERAIEEFGV